MTEAGRRGTRAVGPLLVLLMVLGGVRAAEPAADALPQPLTLQHALSLADAPHPRMQQAQAEMDRARSRLDAARAETGVDVSLRGRVRWVEPSELAPDDQHDDHKAAVVVRKRLYDFGLSEAREAAAREGVQGQRWQYQETRAQRRIRIMERFFDVLLADLEYARDNEAMAVAYVDLDRLRNRHELGQVSDLELLEKESEYQTIRRQRAASQARQRATRSRLALALNRPGGLPAELAPPELPQLERELPPHRTLVEKALEDNPDLQNLRARVAAAGESVEAARAGDRPRVDAVMEGAAYSRELGSRDEWRAGVEFEVPLYNGGRTSSAVAEAKAERYRLQAELAEAEHEVRQAVLDLWLELDTLRTRRDEVRALRDYRELYLDRSRTIYEQEVKTDLGDSMVRLTEAQLAEARTDYRAALAWERMDALTGGPPQAAVSEEQSGDDT
ncbi:MAG TPA: TolC family protein [Gammaproteobacteria bacterium]|nr:TolC family protein [Gammaproteobacteria bacterium]